MSGVRHPDTPWVRVYVDIPREAHERLKQAAAAANMSMKAYLANLITSIKQAKK